MTRLTRQAGCAAALLLMLLVGPGERMMEGTADWQEQAQRGTYSCPMHPDVRSATAGTCPRCGMPLVLADPLAMREYPVEIRTEPHPPAAGRPVRLRITVRDPDTHEVVADFEEVHEKRFHLFVISHDLTHYDHLHPEQERDGVWVLDAVLPRPGFYKLFADFLPQGGTPQVIPHSLVTSGFSGDLASSAARLVPDAELKVRVGGMLVELVLPEGGLVAGRDEKLLYVLADARTGAPITDVEPYLGAWGHTLIMSEDTLHVVHAHPLELLPPESGARGGPRLTFKALLPKPGMYRIWSQISRRGEVQTTVFTVRVQSPTIQRLPRP